MWLHLIISKKNSFFHVQRHSGREINNFFLNGEKNRDWSNIFGFGDWFLYPLTVFEPSAYPFKKTRTFCIFQIFMVDLHVWYITRSSKMSIYLFFWGCMFLRIHSNSKFQGFDFKKFGGKLG